MTDKRVNGLGQEVELDEKTDRWVPVKEDSGNNVGQPEDVPNNEVGESPTTRTNPGEEGP